MEELIQPIINIYNAIEAALLIEVANRFATYDEIGGSLEWQMKKLDELGALNKSTLDIIKKYSGKSEAIINTMLENAGYANLDEKIINKAFEEGLISIDYDKLLSSRSVQELINLSYKEIKKTFRLINTKALESVKQSYMNVINQTYIEVASGIYDYNTSIRRGLQKMAAQGITAATYKRGDTEVRYSIEGTVRRDTLTAVHKLSNQASEQSCNEMGAEYVEISSHLGARVHPTNPIANHAGWQGKVFKLKGEDKEYPNLKKSTGYPDDILGLGGVNCRHRMYPFFPGISEPNKVRFTEDENEIRYKATQEQRRMERDIRTLKKKRAVALACGDEEGVSKLDEMISKKDGQISRFCENNGLKRDFTREQIVLPKEITEAGISNKKGASSLEETKVDWDYINSEEYKAKFNKATDSAGLDKALYEKSKAILTHRDGTLKEDLYLFNEHGDVVGRQTASKKNGVVEINASIRDAVNNSHENSITALHNHPEGFLPSGNDYYISQIRKYKQGFIVTHNGRIFYYKHGDIELDPYRWGTIVDGYIKKGYTERKAVEKATKVYANLYHVEWREL